jgi:hypothetical protein
VLKAKGMAIENSIVENLESSPNVAALFAMQNPLVMVTKVSPTGKKSSDQLVVNGLTGMTGKDILALQETLPVGTLYPNSGPGLYKFEVTDQETTAKVRWQIRLGSASESLEGPRTIAGSPLPFPTRSAIPAPVVQAPPTPAAPDAQNLGNGWVYIPSIDALTAPDGKMHTWRKGMPFPSVEIPTVTAPALPAFTTSTASSPELDTIRTQLAQAQQALNEARERERDEAHRREIEALQTRMERSIEENNKRFETLITSLRPKDDDRVRDLEQKLAERERTDSLRAEMSAKIESLQTIIRDNSNKGPDPVVTALTQMLSEQRHASDSALASMREMMVQERAVARENGLTPEKLLTLLERQALLNKNEPAESFMSKMVNVMDTVLERVMKIASVERELSGSGGTDWISVIKEVGSRAGSALQTFQAAKANEAKAQGLKAEAEIAKARAIEARAKSAPQPRALPAASAAPRPAPRKIKLEDAKIEDLRRVFKPESDERFFGSFLEYVQQLRSEAAKTGVAAGEIAGYFMQARELVAAEAESGNIPHAAEMLAAGQLEYLLERMLPEASEGLRSEILKAIQKLILEEESNARIAANNAATTDDELEKDETVS